MPGLWWQLVQPVKALMALGPLRGAVGLVLGGWDAASKESCWSRLLWMRSVGHQQWQAPAPAPAAHSDI